MRLTVHKVTVIVADALSQVEVALLAVTFAIEQRSAKNGYRSITFDGETNILSRARKAFAIPEEVAFCALLVY